MDTQVLQIDPHHPDPKVIARAAGVLRSGGLVAFPTETVYGLGANALDERAVRRIFAAKGRPARNPLIVHVENADAARPLVRHWPPLAAQLAKHFWPGPLTLVLPKADGIADVVTAGGPTVAIRAPAHAVAQAILKAAALPVAAPSANRSNRLSPTLAAHVLQDLNGAIELLLDAGPTSGGLESTVLDITVSPPRLLRPGLMSPAQIEAVIGPIAPPLSPGGRGVSTTLRSPGLLERHYAPRTPLVCVRDGWLLQPELMEQDKRVGLLTLHSDMYKSSDDVIIVQMPEDAEGYAARLYAELHALDNRNLHRIVVDLPPESEEWLAVHDRLRRASQQ